MTNNKLRVLQWDRWYPMHLHTLYEACPNLAVAPVDEQERALVRDGFSAIHVLAPYLSDMEGIYCVSNCRPQMQAWMRKLGLPMLSGKGDWEAEALRCMVAALRPDVLYIMEPTKFDANFLRTLPYKPSVVIGWHASDVPLGIDWTGYDVMLSALPRMLSFATSSGARHAELFYPGMPNWIAQALENTPQEWDVVFSGSLSPSQHARRFQQLNMLAQAALQQGFSLALHLACSVDILTPAMRPFWHAPVFGLEMHKALARGRIVFDCQGDIGVTGADGRRYIDLAAGSTSNMRLWEATGGGSLLLTQDLPELSAVFTAGEEVAVYNDTTDCHEKIAYFLKHAEERQRIATAGKKRCLGQWNMKNQAAWFQRIIKEALAGQHIDHITPATERNPLIP